MLKTKHDPKKSAWLVRQNTKHAKLFWSGELEQSNLAALKGLTRESGLSIASGEVLWLNHAWYVTSAGLLRVAKENGCDGIQAHVVSTLSDAKTSRWVFKATVYKSPGSRGFIGYGDANPSNVSPLVHGAEMRVAETRAVNRALRKAYGIGLCSVEELGSSRPSKPSLGPPHKNIPLNGGGSTNSQPRLRDQLSLLIREYDLDPTLVKAYAASFCGTQTLSGASRDLVESFISNLSASAKENRDALICKLNSYSRSEQVAS